MKCSVIKLYLKIYPITLEFFSRSKKKIFRRIQILYTKENVRTDFIGTVNLLIGKYCYANALHSIHLGVFMITLYFYRPTFIMMLTDYLFHSLTSFLQFFLLAIFATYLLDISIPSSVHFSFYLSFITRKFDTLLRHCRTVSQISTPFLKSSSMFQSFFFFF